MIERLNYSYYGYGKLYLHDKERKCKINEANTKKFLEKKKT